MTHKKTLLVIFITLFVLVIPNLSALDMPEYTDLGTAQAGEIIPYSIPLRNENPNPDPLTVIITSACVCVTVTTGEITIPGNGFVDVTGFFDSSDYSGPTDKILLIEYMDQNGTQQRDFAVMGLNILVDESELSDSGEGVEEIGCTTCYEIEHLLQKERAREAAFAKLGQESDTDENRNNRIFTAFLFYSAGCRDCEELINRFIPVIEEEYSILIELQEYNIMGKSGFERMSWELDSLGIQEVGELPILIMGSSIYQGISAIEKGLLAAAKGEIISEGKLVSNSEKQSFQTSSEGSGSDSGTESFLKAAAPIPVFLAGLVDGINPCAFSTLLFLISVLTMIGRSRLQIAIIGLVFAGSVFITYMAVGFGLFTAVRALGSFSLAASIIRWVLFSVLVVFTVMSLYDAFLASKGRIKDMILQLPDSMKKRIHKTIREKTRTAAIISGAAVAGVLVSIFELACTGQVYLPTITYMTRVGESGSRGIFLLLIYNIGFIIPLLGVFGMVFAGISSKKAAGVFQRNIVGVKIILAVVFALMAVLTLFT
ncbi:MAG: hypothetical protein HQ557_07245 [Bacteroidetes bacterium]|nr:hypothetical protein [Bacteroidota bacterium]